MIKFIIISIIIIILFIVLFYYNKLNKKNIKNNYESFIDINDSNNNNDKLIITEKNMNNLIDNGNFKNGHNPSNYINQNGYNKIIVKKNPGKSSYVLEQKKSNVLTYYQLKSNCDKNCKYNFYFWLSTDKPDIEELNFDNLINIKVQNESFGTDIPKLNYNIIQQVILSNNDSEVWYLLKYDFITGPNSNNKMDIYLNYSENLKFESYYFTDLSLYKVLIDAENFIYNNKLICYGDGYNYQSNIPTWHDLSGNGNDIFWSAIPISDLTVGSLSLLNQKIIGFPTNLISNEEFSILLCLNKVIENNISDDNVNENNSIKDFYLISLPGNDRYSFEIMFKNNYLYINTGKKNIISKELILYNKSLLSIIYNNNVLNIYLDGVNVLSENIGKIYFTKDSFVINKNKNLNYNLYSILIYNRVIEKQELNEIRDYFIQNKDKNFSIPDINQYNMYNSAQFTVNNLDNSNKILKGYNKRESKNDSIDNYFTDTFDNRNHKQYCLKDCEKLCNLFDEKEECVLNCKKVLLSCQDFCSDPINSTNLLCQNNIQKNIKCPEVYKKNGNYMVYVQPNSFYAKKYNFTGDKSYGINREKARVTYNLNFPDCAIPPELLPGGGTYHNKNCPYIINELNPCYTSSCADVDWSIKNYKNLNINDNCKKAVSNYCHINHYIDDKCICWNPKYKDKKECIEYRRFFENPNDYCSPNSFKIEEHPDFNKYIKKDNIPCWGCNL
jgi:hypothetical protein